MNAPQSRSARQGGPILVALLAMATAMPATAGDPAPPTTISTKRAPPPVPKPAGVVQFDAFRGFDGHGNGNGDGQTPMEIGVAVGLATCPDGNTVVGGLNAGGWRYDVADACANSGAAPQGSVAYHQAPAPAGTTTATPPRAPASAPAQAAPQPAPPAKTNPPRCDPATWRCSTAQP
jgi:hypothetical protein